MLVITSFFSLGVTVVKSQSLCSLQPQNEAQEVFLFEFFSICKVYSVEHL